MIPYVLLQIQSNLCYIVWYAIWHLCSFYKPNLKSIYMDTQCVYILLICGSSNGTTCFSGASISVEIFIFVYDALLINVYIAVLIGMCAWFVYL